MTEGSVTGKGTFGLATPDQGEPELIVVSGEREAAEVAAERIARAVIAAAAERGRADFCTTGGNTPIPIYKLLAQGPYRDEIPWRRVHFWWGDDRVVPRDHPESNTTSFDDVLLRLGAFSGESGTGDSGTDVEADMASGVVIPPENIHVFPVDLALREKRDNSWCARRYAEEMAASLPVSESNWPLFDLILVGVGDDGHVLSCFPGSQALDSSDWTLGIPAPTHIGPHIDRVTMNPRILDGSPVLAVTWGAKKADALGHVFGDVRDDRQWPVQRTRRPGAAWVVDESAAAQIPENLRRG